MENKWGIKAADESEAARYLNPADISLPPGYRAEVFAEGLDCPICMQFDGDGSLYVAESGLTSINPRILKLSGGQVEAVADGFNREITGVNILHGELYVSHIGKITVIKLDKTRSDIISGLPSYGDYRNSKVVFGFDRKMYFSVGTATNSGVVGPDNFWLAEQPFLHDYPGDYIMLKGQNFESNNFFSATQEKAYTGAYSPYGTANLPYEVKKGMVKASGSVLRSNLDGSGLEVFAWGLRNPFGIGFDESGRLFVSNRGFDVRGSRPIANAPDDFYQVLEGTWYGWPDYTGGDPVTMERFMPDGGPRPEFLITNHPGIPPRPLSVFPPHGSISGFAFNYDYDFGPYGNAYIAECGSLGPRAAGSTATIAGVGHRVSQIDMNTGGITVFAINKSGFSAVISREGGFSRPVDVVFGPDKAMYVLDMGTYDINIPDSFLPSTGVIWKITRTG